MIKDEGSRLAGVDPELAAELGFLKTKYIAVERERRWLGRDVPRELVLRSEAIDDLYVAGTRLRLREARPSDGSRPQLKLTRKADVDPATRLLTTIYLPESEFAVLSATLQGARLRKLRHRLQAPPGVSLAVDEFHGELAGLVLIEAEFVTDEERVAFPSPPFALREVTDDPRYTGGQLVRHGLPQEP
jgi:CYTH domain-containing protein